jgi:hypothetical protein
MNTPPIVRPIIVSRNGQPPGVSRFHTRRGIDIAS